jgi:hypothetical protein
MNTDTENVADDAAAVAGDGSEADLLRDCLRLAVIKMATAEGRAPLSSLLLLAWLTPAPLWPPLVPHAAGSVLVCAGRKAGMEVAEPVVACVADLAFKSAGLPPPLHLILHMVLPDIGAP